VREVVAHEVGHVLGLRHNFAGSLAATLTQKELDDGSGPTSPANPWTPTPTKSLPAVMDYNILKSGLFHRLAHAHGQGRRCRTTSAAIAWGYFDSSEARTNKLLFGTDEDTSVTAMSAVSITVMSRWSATTTRSPR
jgi:hypothetical protein